MAAQKALATQLKTSTGATDAQVKAVEKWITKTSLAAAVTDEKLRPALASLLRNTKDVTRAQELANIALDVATATGKDYEAVAIALGKAETGNYNALKKLGIPLGDNAEALKLQAKFTKELIKYQTDYQYAVEQYGPTSKEAVKALEKVEKAQTKVNNATVAGADYTKDLIDQFGGANKAFTETAAGGMKKLGIAFDETKESIGMAFLPIMEKVLPVVTKFSDWASANPQLLAAVTAGVGALAISTLALNAAMAVNPFVAMAAGLIAVAIAMNKLADAAEKIKGVGGIAAKIIGSIALPGFAGALVGNAIERITGNNAPSVAPSTSNANIGRSADSADRAVNITVNAGVGDPVAIGKSVVDALNAYRARTGSLGLAGY